MIKETDIEILMHTLNANFPYTFVSTEFFQRVLTLAMKKSQISLLLVTLIWSRQFLQIRVHCLAAFSPDPFTLTRGGQGKIFVL